MSMTTIVTTENKATNLLSELSVGDWFSFCEGDGGLFLVTEAFKGNTSGVDRILDVATGVISSVQHDSYVRLHKSVFIRVQE